MSAILISLDHSRRVAIDDTPLADDTFTARFLLNPDGDFALSRQYGYLHVTVSGDSQKLPDVKLSELQDWIAEGMSKLIASRLPNSPV